MGSDYTCDICGKTEKGLWPCDCHERLAAHGLHLLVGRRVEAASLVRLNPGEAPAVCLKLINNKGESEIVLISTHKDMYEQPYVGGVSATGVSEDVYELFQRSAIKPSSPTVLGIPDQVDVVMNHDGEDSGVETDGDDSDNDGGEENIDNSGGKGKGIVEKTQESRDCKVVRGTTCLHTTLSGKSLCGRLVPPQFYDQERCAIHATISQGTTSLPEVPTRNACAYSRPQPVACIRLTPNTPNETERPHECSTHSKHEHLLARPDSYIGGDVGMMAMVRENSFITDPVLMGYKQSDPPTWRDCEAVSDRKVFLVCRPGQFTCQLTITEGWIRLGSGEFYGITNGQSFTTDFQSGNMDKRRYHCLVKKGAIEKVSGDADGLYSMLGYFFNDVHKEASGNEISGFRMDRILLSVNHSSADAGVTFNLVAPK